MQQTTPNALPKPLTPDEREGMINNLIWTFEVSGIEVTRAEAEAALDHALSKPLPDF